MEIPSTEPEAAIVDISSTSPNTSPPNNEPNTEPTIGFNEYDFSTMTLTWHNLSVWIKKKERGSFWKNSRYENYQILKDVNGFVKSGTLTAVMGASGTGKTTLLATLSQRMKVGDTKGDIRINGLTVEHDLMNKMSGFVPQHDLAVESLTVNEHMTFMARLKMDRRVSAVERVDRIEWLLRELGISKCKHTPLRAVSGGERRRLALAVQLLLDPPLLFCDEPTAGLDSFNANSVIEKLRHFASRGKTVLCTIHQPASGIFDMFSKVILLADGRVAYQGDVENAALFFTSQNLICPVNYNKAEFYISHLAIQPGNEEESIDKIHRLCDIFQSSCFGEVLTKELKMHEESRHSILGYKDNNHFPAYHAILKVRRHTQIYWLTWRSRIDIIRNLSHHILRFGLYLMLAIVMATPYTDIKVNQSGIQDLQGLMYMIITQTVFCYTYSVFHTFPGEISIFLREIGNGLYTPGPYYLSKMIILLPQAIFEPLVYTMIIFYVAELKGGVLGLITITLPVIMCAITATAYGCSISAIFESVPMASLLASMFDFIFVVTSGLYVQLGNLPPYLAWLPYTSQFFYGIEAVSITQWRHIDKIECPANQNLPCISTGEEVLLNYGFNINNFPLDFAGLFAIYAIAHIIGFSSILRRSTNQPIY